MPVRRSGQILRLVFVRKLLIRDVTGVAKVVGHHDRGIQRGKVKSGDRPVVEAFFGVNDNSSLKLVASVLHPTNRNHQVHSFCLSVELAGYFDLLATREQEADGYASDSSHFSKVEEAHQFV